jgi:hypothetical protein
LWRSVKQTLVATSTNHSEIIALYEATRECVWLRRMTNHIQKSINTPTIIYEDNAACVAQMHMGYVKNNLTKHIAPKFCYPHELQKSGEIKILQARSCDNFADLFTKSLPATSFYKCIYGIGMRRLRDLRGSGETDPENHSPCFVILKITSRSYRPDLSISCCAIRFFPLDEFFPTGVFSCKVFNEATSAIRLARTMHSFLLPFFPTGFWGGGVFNEA